MYISSNRQVFASWFTRKWMYKNERYELLFMQIVDTKQENEVMCIYHKRTRARARTHARKRARTHTHTARTHTHILTHAHTRARTHTHKNTHTHIHTHTHTHTHEHTHIHTNTHTHTHTHTQVWEEGREQTYTETVYSIMYIAQERKKI